MYIEFQLLNYINDVPLSSYIWKLSFNTDPQDIDDGDEPVFYPQIFAISSTGQVYPYYPPGHHEPPLPDPAFLAGLCQSVCLGVLQTPGIQDLLSKSRGKIQDGLAPSKPSSTSSSQSSSSNKEERQSASESGLASDVAEHVITLTADSSTGGSTHEMPIITGSQVTCSTPNSFQTGEQATEVTDQSTEVTESKGQLSTTVLDPLTALDSTASTSIDITIKSKSNIFMTDSPSDLPTMVPMTMDKDSTGSMGANSWKEPKMYTSINTLNTTNTPAISELSKSNIAEDNTMKYSSDTFIPTQEVTTASFDMYNTINQTSSSKTESAMLNSSTMLFSTGDSSTDLFTTNSVIIDRIMPSTGESESTTLGNTEKDPSKPTNKSMDSTEYNGLIIETTIASNTKLKSTYLPKSTPTTEAYLRISYAVSKTPKMDITVQPPMTVESTTISTMPTESDNTVVPPKSIMITSTPTESAPTLSMPSGSRSTSNVSTEVTTISVSEVVGRPSESPYITSMPTESATSTSLTLESITTSMSSKVGASTRLTPETTTAQYIVPPPEYEGALCVFIVKGKPTIGAC
jgi:hypothetical protein